MQVDSEHSGQSLDNRNYQDGSQARDLWQIVVFQNVISMQQRHYCHEINNQKIDDHYVKLSFLAEEAKISINPIGEQAEVLCRMRRTKARLVTKHNA